MKLKPSEKVIGYCDKCRATLRVGRRTEPANYHAAAASQGWQWTPTSTGVVSITCRKCLAAERAAAQGTLAL